MNSTEILNAIKLLAKSQGFYGRLYDKLIDGSKESEDFLQELESKNFNDITDLILYYE